MDDKCILDPERDCLGKAEAAKLEGRIKALEKWQEDSKDFHAKFYDWQREQIARDARLDEKLSVMDTNIKKLLSEQEKQREIQQNSQQSEIDSQKKRARDLLDKVLWLVIGAVLMALLKVIGL